LLIYFLIKKYFKNIFYRNPNIYATYWPWPRLTKRREKLASVCEIVKYQQCNGHGGDWNGESKMRTATTFKNGKE
jgi:hypothetical protein